MICWLGHYLPVCPTKCCHTYVLAAKKSQCTGMKSKQIMSDVKAMNIKTTENACNQTDNMHSFIV